MSQRIGSIDLLRGIVMVLMALDHVRDFFSPVSFDPTDLSQADPALFFTRWITHFCAPVFVFLAGTSAWLYRASAGLDAAALSRFLMTRGLWLIVVEFTLVNFGWTFAVPFTFLFVQVIWAIGVSMVVLGLLVHLPFRAIVGVGALMVLGHNALDGLSAADMGAFAPWWMVLHEDGMASFPGGVGVYIAYPVIPWIGVMALGYAFGRVLERPDRFAAVARIGLGLCLLFVVLRATGLYGDPRPWSVDPRGYLYTLAAFLNTEKYPPSLLYLCMTLGPALLMLPVLERLRGGLWEAVTVFGRVPFFYYVVHLPVIHAAAVVWSLAAYGSVLNFFAGPAGIPAGYAPSLGRTWLVWALVVVALYWPCRWYAGYKARNRDKTWLTYL